jgi:hypothetical protein
VVVLGAPPANTAPTQAKASDLYMICTMAKHEVEAQGRAVGKKVVATAA